MKNGKTVVAQIGCGAFARDQDLPNLSAHPDVELRYCCDPRIESAEEAAKRFGAAKAVADYMEVIDDPELDFVKVTTPHDMHKPIVMEAARRGKHVFCEKPMAMELSDCWEMMSAIRRHGVKFCVDLNRRMSPAMAALRARVREQLADERHNPWRYIETERPRLPEELAVNFLIRIQDESASYRMIHLDPMHGGGQILGETVHWLDLATWFFDDQVPLALTAWGSSRLTHGINIRFSGGDTATILFDACGTFDYPKEIYEVTCRGALFRSLFFTENRYYGIPGLSSETFPLQRDGFRDKVPGDGFDAYMRKMEMWHGADLKANWMALTVDKGHRAMLDGFVKAVRDGAPVPCDEYAGMRSLLLAQLAIKSMKSGMTVPVPIEDWQPVFA